MALGETESCWTESQKNWVLVSALTDVACVRYEEIFDLVRRNFPLSHSVNI